MVACGLATSAVHVEEDGEGLPLLMLPSFAGSSESWGVVVVRNLTARFRVLRVDWPGLGRSPVADQPITLGSLSVALAAALDRHDASQVSVLGWGLGALVALELAAARPDQMRRLALCGSSTGGGPLLAAYPTVSALCGVGEDAGPEAHMLGLLGRLVSPGWRPFAEMFLPQLLPHPAATLTALRGQWAALEGCDLRPRLRDVRAPTLLVTGAADQLTPPLLATELAAALPTAAVRLVAGAGHAVLWEQPGEVLGALIPFLEVAAESLSGGAIRAELQGIPRSSEGRTG